MSKNSWSKEKRAEYDKKRYESQKEKILKQHQDRRLEIKNWFIELKASLKCSNCPEDDPCCLDFHHVDPSEKEITVSDAAKSGWSKIRIQKEIDKCIVLCANCHRKLHNSLIGV